MLGQHYLSHRELGTFHRGDLTRVYLQELCAYAPDDGPTDPVKYSATGHVDVATWNFDFTPVAHARVRKEGIIGTGLPFVEVSLQGGGSMDFPRHAERYTFTLPSLILASPLNEECPLDYDGVCSIECAATGLRTVLKFKAWREGFVKGEVSRLAGEGESKIARLEGHWQTQITAYGLNNRTEGTLYDSNDFLPVLQLPPVINLQQPGPQTIPRLWSSVIEAVLYLDKEEAEKGGKSAAELNAALPETLKSSLLFFPPEVPVKDREFNEEEARIVAQDSRPLPPASRVQRGLGRDLRYQLHYRIQSITTVALEQEVQEMNLKAAADGFMPSSSSTTFATYK